MSTEPFGEQPTLVESPDPTRHRAGIIVAGSFRIRPSSRHCRRLATVGTRYSVVFDAPRPG